MQNDNSAAPEGGVGALMSVLADSPLAMLAVIAVLLDDAGEVSTKISQERLSEVTARFNLSSRVDEEGNLILMLSQLT